MRELFENLKMRQFENSPSADKTTESRNNYSLFGQPEQMELAQFGKVIHDWRPRGKQRKIKQEENK